MFAEQSNRTRRVADGEFGYLSQPEMKDFLQAALDLGWTLVPYEADQFKWLSLRHGVQFSDADDVTERQKRYQEFQTEFMGLEFTNWREEQQAQNIIHAMAPMPAGTKLLVWCGNSHLEKKPSQDWVPMGYQFQRLAGLEAFAIDETITVKFDESEFRLRLIRKFSKELERRGGTAGFLGEEAPSILRGEDSLDAVLLSTQNELE